MISLTPDQFRKSGYGMTPSPMPFLTPRPERRRVDTNFNRPDRDKEVNVQVLVRCRPLSDEEQRLNIPKVVTCNEAKREVTVLQSVANKQVDKVFSFDKVFGPKSQQRSIYEQAIAPIVNEVLDGFNCTVFAYGQTGTGKTYTMEGGMRNKGGDLPADAGVIPRAVRQIFDTLEAQNADYSVKVTFLELYNEEITDLLATDDNSRSIEDRQKRPISLMEDGKGCVVVRGLEEEAVYSANDIYDLLERGAVKRRTADTFLNKRSSRSHSVFSITVHIKESTVGEEELIKCGKLNLVDLAGSENISRSGAREGRAREAGEINKSLLTLGRVINTLVEHSAHIPYRDSKLTRLLRDSLGGKTKTCIIATISPSPYSLEETLSTLDYAYRAKNIKNKPEANQKMSKTVLLKDLYLEIERMKEDVRAARDKHGVYVPHERYVQEEAEKKARIINIEQLENELNQCEKKAHKFQELYLTVKEEKLDLESELKSCKIKLETSDKSMVELQANHSIAISSLKEKELIISKMKISESSLIDRAKTLGSDLRLASEDITSLSAKLDRKEKMEAGNQRLLLKYGSQLDQNLKDLHKMTLMSISQQQQQLISMEEHARSYLASKFEATHDFESRIKNMTETYSSGIVTLQELAEMVKSKSLSDLEHIDSTVSCQIEAVEQFIVDAVLEAKGVTEDMQKSLNEQKELLAFTAGKQQEGLQRSLASAQAIFSATVEFLSDLHYQTSQVQEILEESHTEKSRQLATFESMFKEEAAKEEKQALEKIAVILSSLTSKKTTMVSEASQNINAHNVLEKQRLQQQMFNMQQVSNDAKKQLGNYMEKAESHYIEDTFSTAESTTIMESSLQECSNKVEHSKHQWEKACSHISDMNTNSSEELQAAMIEKVCTNQTMHDCFASALSSMEAEITDSTEDLLEVVNDSFMQDHESKKDVDSMTTACLDHLKLLQENHGQRISNTRTDAENCLIKDYLVDQHMDTTPKKRANTVPSLAAFIEETTTPSPENLKYQHSEKGSKCCKKESKMHQELLLQQVDLAESPNRTPFAHLNRTVTENS